MLKKKKVILLSVIVILIITLLITYLLVNRSIDIEKTKASVMLIYSYDENGELISSGSGFVGFENDVLVTNAHVIEDAFEIEIISETNNKYNSVGIIGYDAKNDIAIFRLEKYKNLNKLPISKKIEVGDEVYAIGSPLGIKNTVSNGILSGMREEKGINVYQYTAPISPGSSGGALLNEKGQVVGITYASIVDGQNLNLAIKISDVEKLYNKSKVNVPVKLKNKELVSLKLKVNDVFKKLIKKIETENFSEYKISDKNINDQKMQLLARINGKNSHDLYINQDGFETKNNEECTCAIRSDGVCTINDLEDGSDTRKCTENSINPLYKGLTINIFSKSGIEFSKFEDYIMEDISFDTKMYYSIFFDNFENKYYNVYQDENYYYFVTYTGFVKKEIDLIFEK